MHALVGRVAAAAVAVAVLCAGCDDPSAPPPAAPSASPSPEDTTPKVVADCFHARREPKRMVLACADAGFRGAQLRWAVWGPRRARGSGVFRANDCKPGCVVGTIHSIPGDITLDGVRPCPQTGGDVFMTGRVRLRAPVAGTRSYDISPGCPAGG